MSCWDEVEKHKRFVLSWVLFLQDHDPNDTEEIAKLNKYCSDTLYRKKNKLREETENSTYRSLYHRGHTETLEEQYTKWMNGLKIK